jgi:hypothetical protein
MAKINYDVSSHLAPLPPPEDKVYIYCPLCKSRRGDITPKPHPDPLAPCWVGCRDCDAEGVSRAEWLARVAFKVKTTQPQLLAEPWRYLQQYAVKKWSPPSP